MSHDFLIGGETIQLRSRRLIELPLPPLYTHTPMTLPVHVVRGAKGGPRLFVSAALHGDELNGTEIIRRLLKQSVLKCLRSTLVSTWRNSWCSAVSSSPVQSIYVIDNSTDTVRHEFT